MTASVPPVRAVPTGGTGGRASPTTMLSHVWSGPAATLFLVMLVTLAGEAAANVAGLLCFALGLAHGAGERDARGLRPASIGYVAAYVVAAAVALATYLLSPSVLIWTFFGLSVWHFGRSDPLGLGTGLVVVTAPFALWPDSTADLMATMGSTAILPVEFAVPAMLLGLLAMTSHASRSSGLLLRMALLLATFLILPPLASVGVYFLAFHSFPELAKIAARMSSPGFDANPILACIAFAFIGLAALAAGFAAGMVPLALLCAVGLAFVVPHMLLPSGD